MVPALARLSPLAMSSLRSGTLGRALLRGVRASYSMVVGGGLGDTATATATATSGAALRAMLRLRCAVGAGMRGARVAILPPAPCQLSGICGRAYSSSSPSMRKFLLRNQSRFASTLSTGDQDGQDRDGKDDDDGDDDGDDLEAAIREDRADLGVAEYGSLSDDEDEDDFWDETIEGWVDEDNYWPELSYGAEEEEVLTEEELSQMIDAVSVDSEENQELWEEVQRNIEDTLRTEFSAMGLPGFRKAPVFNVEHVADPVRSAEIAEQEGLKGKELPVAWDSLADDDTGYTEKYFDVERSSYKVIDMILEEMMKPPGKESELLGLIDDRLPHLKSRFRKDYIEGTPFSQREVVENEAFFDEIVDIVCERINDSNGPDELVRDLLSKSGEDLKSHMEKIFDEKADADTIKSALFSSSKTGGESLKHMAREKVAETTWASILKSEGIDMDNDSSGGDDDGDDDDGRSSGKAGAGRDAKGHGRGGTPSGGGAKAQGRLPELLLKKIREHPYVSDVQRDVNRGTEPAESWVEAAARLALRHGVPMEHALDVMQTARHLKILAELRKRQESGLGEVRPSDMKVSLKGNCRFCMPDVTHSKMLRMDVTNVSLLLRFTDGAGKIIPRKETGTCAKHHHRVVELVKQARYLGLLSFSGRVEQHRQPTSL